MSLTIEHRDMDGKFVLDTESRGYPFLYAKPDKYGNAYLGSSAQDDLRGLAKAILNAIEPDALVENQKAVKPEPREFQVGDIVRVIAPMYARTAWGKNEHLVAMVSGDIVSIKHDTMGLGGFYPEELELITPASAPAEFDIPALAAAVNNLQDRVDDLEKAAAETEPTLWGYKVGDLVEYTEVGTLPGAIRKVLRIEYGHIKLAHPHGKNVTGTALTPHEIRKVD